MNASPVSLPRFWSHLTTRDFAALDVAATVAVLPLGATEQHGPHLPLGVDTVLADGIVAASLPLLPADLPVLFLPTQQIGLSPEHARFAGTLTLSAETLIRMWNEIGAGVARAGVKKLVLFNAHGGHVGAMDIVARELRAAHGLIVYSVSWFNLPLGDAGAQFGADEHRFGLPVVALSGQERATFQPEHLHAVHGEPVPEGSAARAGPDDDNVVVLVVCHSEPSPSSVLPLVTLRLPRDTRLSRRSRVTSTPAEG